MEQFENPKIGIIGAGRVGSSFASASFPNGEVVAASSRRPAHREWLSKRSPNIVVVDNAAKVADLADLVFITTNDAAIKPVCDSIPWQPHHHVIHCSGALTPDVLQIGPKRRSGRSRFPSPSNLPQTRQPRSPLQHWVRHRLP